MEAPPQNDGSSQKRSAAVRQHCFLEILECKCAKRWKAIYTMLLSVFQVRPVLVSALWGEAGTAAGQHPGVLQSLASSLSLPHLLFNSLPHLFQLLLVVDVHCQALYCQPVLWMLSRIFLAISIRPHENYRSKHLVVHHSFLVHTESSHRNCIFFVEISCYRDREWLDEDTLEKRRKEIVFIIILRYPKICFMHWFCVLDLKIIHIKDEGQAFFPVCQKGSSPTCLASEFCSWLVCKFCLLLLLSVQWLIFRLLAS